MDARDLRDALRQLVVAHGALDAAERPCGTPLSTAHAWALLELRDGPLTVTELAGRLNIDRTNVSRLCRRMADAGELARTTHPDDARARLVTLTEVGRALADRVDAASARHFQRVMDRLANADQVVDALHQLTRTLTEEDA